MNIQSQKKDALFSLLCGELSALFVLFIINNPYITELHKLAKIGALIWVLPVATPVIFFVGIVVAKFLSKIVSLFYQLAKFLEIGVLNTLVDMGVLNFLVSISGVTAGATLGAFNTLSFSLAVVNSYFWNKFWTFNKESKAGGGKEFTSFIIVSVIGWAINTGIVVLGTTYLAAKDSFSAGAWVNIMKIAATFIAMAWNFVGYKFIVFKAKNN